MIRKVISKIRTKIMGYYVPVYFFSKAGEDAILYNLLYEKIKHKSYKGFYVDIGAHHPFINSNTYFFYLNGWSGINVDANEHMVSLLKKYRKLDTNLHYGVDNVDGVADFIYSVLTLP